MHYSLDSPLGLTDEAEITWTRGELKGGAVVADACNTVQATVADVLGVAVIDVVEGQYFIPPVVQPLFGSRRDSQGID